MLPQRNSRKKAGKDEVKAKVLVKGKPPGNKQVGTKLQSEKTKTKENMKPKEKLAPKKREEKRNANTKANANTNAKAITKAITKAISKANTKANTKGKEEDEVEDDEEEPLVVGKKTTGQKPKIDSVSKVVTKSKTGTTSSTTKANNGSIQLEVYDDKTLLLRALSAIKRARDSETLLTSRTKFGIGR
jgi:hypothetical protein